MFEILVVFGNLLVSGRLLNLEISEHFHEVFELGVVLRSCSGVHLLLELLQSVVFGYTRDNHSFIDYNSLIIRIIIWGIQNYKFSNENLLLDSRILVPENPVSKVNFFDMLKIHPLFFLSEFLDHVDVLDAAVDEFELIILLRFDELVLRELMESVRHVK